MTQHPLAARILELIPINGLDPDLQQQVLAKGEVLDIRRRKTVFEAGARDAYTFYLLDGELELESETSSPVPMRAGDDNARRALAQLQPRRYTARARTPVQVFRIERAMLDYILSDEQVLERASEMQVAELETSQDEVDWMSRLLSSALFARLPPDNIQKFFSELEPMEVAAGDLIVEQGTEGDYLYIIAEGQCVVSRRAPRTGQEVSLATLREGDSFGEEALVSSTPRNASVSMLSDGFLMRLPKRSFEELVSRPTLKPVPWSEARKLVKEGVRWLDVRFADEHDNCAIADSLNIPLNVLRLELAKLDRATSYLLYCDSGARSSTGAFLLAREGFDAYYLAGGLEHIPEGEEVALTGADGNAPQDEPRPAGGPVAVPAPEAASRAPEIPHDVRAELDELSRHAQALKAERDRAASFAQQAADTARDLKRRYDELYRAAHQERAARLALEKDLATSKAEAERRLAMEEARLAGELEKAQARARELESDLQAQRERRESEHARLSKELAAVREEHGRARGELKSLQAARQAAQGDFDQRQKSLQAELETERARSANVQEQLSQLRTELERARLSSDQLARSQADMEQALQQRLASTRSTLEEQRAELELQRSALVRDGESLGREREQLEKAVNDHQRALQAQAHEMAERTAALDEREARIEDQRKAIDLELARRTEALTAEDARLGEEKLAWQSRIDEAIEVERRRLEAAYESYKAELADQTKMDQVAMAEEREAELRAEYEARLVGQESSSRAQLDAAAAQAKQRIRMERTSFEDRMSALTRVYEVRLAEQAAMLLDEQRQLATGTVRLREALEETERLKQDLRQARDDDASPGAAGDAGPGIAPAPVVVAQPQRPALGSGLPVLDCDPAPRRTAGPANDERARVLSADQIAAIRQKMQDKLNASRRGA